MKKQRQVDEERYAVLSKRLSAFCADSIFVANENLDIVRSGHEDYLMSMFIQANTIEEMINKTYDEQPEQSNEPEVVEEENNRSPLQQSPHS